MKAWLVFHLMTVALSLAPKFAAAAPTCENLFRPMVAVPEDSARAGILMHGEHWVDLILVQAGTTDPRPLRAFDETLNQLVRGIEQGRLSNTNEKIDGSPSVVFGFTPEGKPFVAYKGHLTKKEQAFVTTASEAAVQFANNLELQALFAKLIAVAKDPLFQHRRQFQNLIFQGDVLFSRTEISDSQVRIQANSVEYTIPRDHDLYAPVKTAQVGIVFHSVGQRTIDGDGRIGVKPLATDREEVTVKAFADAMTTPAFLALHPWRDNVRTLALTDAKKQKLFRYIETRSSFIREALAKLSPDFRDEWKSRFEASFRTFLNAGLRPPHDGGFYREAASGGWLESGEIQAWGKQFEIWLRVRGEDADADNYAKFRLRHASELSGFIQAYAAGVALQYQLQHALAPVMVSKLGGGEIEGLMLKTEDSVVKWVDRLGFTLKNNIRWSRASRSDRYAVPAPLANRFDLPFPYETWHPGASFVLMKGQPIHTGHIQMIREAASPGKDTFVVASEKEPNLTALNWKDLGVSATKKELTARDYTYIFDQDFRRKLLREGLPEEIIVTMVSTRHFRNYLHAAKTAGLPGKIKLVVGEKEVAEGRYDDLLKEFGGQFELQPVALKEDGLSATQVRDALKIAATGKKAEREGAIAKLNQAFSYIESDTARKRAINKAIRRWQEVDEAVQPLVVATPRKKGA